ncbi:MAG TPA: hypothetical protein VHY33_15130 [Thermoanaerobaculia bacterium]|jgi:hypothetical protein|nr:hypothetical protein [Thermoanaerobaculia bacterium]
MLQARELTKPGDVITIAAPFTGWHQGYAYLYTRALYPLTGRTLVPLIDEYDRPRADNLAKANVIVAYSCEPHVPGFATVWRGHDGLLMRRMR